METPTRETSVASQATGRQRRGGLDRGLAWIRAGGVQRLCIPTTRAGSRAQPMLQIGKAYISSRHALVLLGLEWFSGVRLFRSGCAPRRRVLTELCFQTQLSDSELKLANVLDPQVWRKCSASMMLLTCDVRCWADGPGCVQGFEVQGLGRMIAQGLCVLSCDAPGSDLAYLAMLCPALT
eukprot:244841-Rhodomonas_salina.1